MASATSFASGGGSLRFVQPVSYDRSNGRQQICLRIGSQPNSNSLLAKSLRLEPKDEFANGFPRFGRLVVCCKSSSPVTPSRNLKRDLDMSFGDFAAPVVFSKAEVGIKAFRPMLEAIYKFIQCHPPPTPHKVVVGESSEPDLVLMQGPYLESRIERAIQYKNENGEAYVQIN
ncbi:hypothetical protein FEM48_Zijuj08G0122800 [Ziziphus jujuba var. spinosa]|uniref:Uncharacterized protein n=1 Tax=Ziziphus jujuba var. spinosa TaxID=714518 RepID=A0A978UZ20_ZIZJJ|nr:hypothetical protein FEM48_Zijuj08G0122800 [Ziziphus jujuba var. spinosa]